MELLILKKIVVTKTLPFQIKEVIYENFEVLFFNNVTEETYEDFLAALTEAEGMIITVDFEFTEEIMEHMHKIKGVSTISVGYDGIPVKELSKRNIVCTNTPDILSEATADLIFGLILSTARRIPELDTMVKEGYWTRSIGEDFFGTNVYGKKLGIIGLGSIGEAVAKRASLGFGMEVSYHNRSRNERAEKESSAVYETLDELLETSDFVCLTVPLTPETEGLIGLNEFKKMKESAILVNGSRGKVVVEKDLITALKQGLIAGAGLDVYETEPIQMDNELLTFSNVITLPHAGSATNETRLDMAKLAICNLLDVLHDRTPRNPIYK